MPGSASEGVDHDRPVVRVRDIRKSYGLIEVLKGVSLSVFAGDVIALIGSSGSGKSTLLRCVNLLEVPNAGSVEIAGEDVKLKHVGGGRRAIADAGQLRRIRSRLGMVFHSFNLWAHLTVLENVILAPRQVLGQSGPAATEHGEALLRKVGLFDKRHAYPANLSGGQQQRAAIARALAIDPLVMLFDEPTSALDPDLAGEVLRVIRALAEEGRTMIVVTQEMRFARDVASHVAFLHNGLIEEEGPPDQVFRDPASERCRQFVSASAR